MLGALVLFTSLAGTFNTSGRTLVVDGVPHLMRGGTHQRPQFSLLLVGRTPSLISAACPLTPYLTCT